jgi:hypothetical protein
MTRAPTTTATAVITFHYLRDRFEFQSTAVRSGLGAGLPAA